MTRTFAIASGKGGVGKTWFAISLSQALARSNQRVLLVDCDIGLANVDVQLALEGGADLRMAALGQAPLSRVIRTETAFGFDVLPGRSGKGSTLGLDSFVVGWLQRTLKTIGNRYDTIVLDLPPGADQGVRDMWRFADQDILLTTGEPTALTDAYALIKATRGGRISATPVIVVNIADHEEGGRQTLNGLINVCKRFLAIEPVGAGVIRRDSAVPDAIARQCPLLTCHPKSDAARDVIAIARLLAIRCGRP